jgi:7-carboxy-7-deazaguanine synthase
MTKKFPVAEIFGPTIQGEGLEQGIPCHFIRLGGCDFKCDWCDTPHAVLPQAVKHLPRMATDEILDAVDGLTGNPDWVVLSGGNPALHDLGDLVRGLQRRGKRVAVETQGTRYKPWLTWVDSLCVSPKPPSSGMKYSTGDLRKFFRQPEDNFRSSSPFFAKMAREGRLFLKVVVFDHTDYEWAKKVHNFFPWIPFFVSAGNDAGKTVGNPSREDDRSDAEIKLQLLSQARWLTNRVMVDPEMRRVRVQAQFHVLLWSNELGR